MSAIAFIGLGNMGGPMAANQLKRGHSVRGFDLAPAALAVAAGAGVTIAESAREAVAGAEIVITMLLAGKHVIAAYTGFLPTLANDVLLIDRSTIDVDSARKAHELSALRLVQRVGTRRR